MGAMGEGGKCGKGVVGGVLEHKVVKQPVFPEMCVVVVKWLVPVHVV